MQRVCFQLQIQPERIAEYRAHHEAVWADVLLANSEAGRRNYSLFLRNDGLLIGYYEVDDDEAAQRRLSEDLRTHRWELLMASYFVGVQSRPDQDALRLVEIFHLETQLAAISQASIPTESIQKVDQH